MAKAEHASVEGKDKIMWWEKERPNPVRYQSNCPTIKTYNKHHILPGVSMGISITAASKDKPNLEEALRYFTKWNINEAHNLIALPTVYTYRALYGKQGERTGPIARLAMKGLVFNAAGKLADIAGPGSLPCHQTTNWGHTDYNDLVEADLMEVWADVTIKMEKHKVTSSDVSGAITAKETKWKTKLTTGRTPTLAKWKATMAGESGKPYNEFTMVPLTASPI